MNKVLEPTGSICIPCRGTKYLCGRSYCPLLLRNVKILKSLELNKKVIEGSSPPSIFVGRINYPNVRVGPLVPPYLGDTSIYDEPERWNNLKIDDILNFRFSLLRSYKFTNINLVRKEDRFLLSLHEIALSKIPVDLRVFLKKNPSKIPLFDDIIPPLGSSAPLERFIIESSIKTDKDIEKVYYDKDLFAEDAVIKLYNENVQHSKIVKVFSLGMLGVKKNRKLVPTRWSITAIDDILSKFYLNKIKDFNEINEIRVYHSLSNLNNFIILLFPNYWIYEWIEIWYPNTTWNLYGEKPEVEADHEINGPKKEYSILGGCYYAVRLAVTEYLFKQRRKASVLAIREIYPGFVTNIGVWFVRNSIKKTLESNYEKFDDINKALSFAFSKIKTKKENIIEKSFILKLFYFQKRLISY